MRLRRPDIVHKQNRKQTSKKTNSPHLRSEPTNMQAVLTLQHSTVPPT
jgi:hypothetical protein